MQLVYDGTWLNKPVVVVPGAGKKSLMRQEIKICKFIFLFIVTIFCTMFHQYSSLNTFTFTKQQKSDFNGRLNFDTKAAQRIQIKFVGISEELLRLYYKQNPSDDIVSKTLVYQVFFTNCLTRIKTKILNIKNFLSTK